MICDQCGASTPSSSRFCHECGAPVIQKPAPRVRVREEYAQRVFSFGCLITLLVAVVAGLIVGIASRPLGVLAMMGIIIAGVIFMRVLFGARKH